MPTFAARLSDDKVAPKGAIRGRFRHLVIRDQIALPTETMGSPPGTRKHTDCNLPSPPGCGRSTRIKTASNVWMARANGRRNAALSIYSGRLAFSGVMDQAHKAFILMILMMAMEQRQTGVIGNEVDICGREPNHVERVLHQP